MWYFASGDSGFYFIDQLKSLSWFPSAWYYGRGLGMSTIIRLWFDYPYLLSIKTLSSIGLSWWAIDKILWIFLLFLSIYSIWKLARGLGISKQLSIIASIIYCLNTSILMIAGGGQIGVSLGYGFSPFVLLKFIQSINNYQIHRSSGGYGFRSGLLNGLLLAFLTAYDLRMAYIVIGIVIFYFLFRSGEINVNRLFTILNTVIVPIIISVVIHAFWILPLLFTGGSFAYIEEYAGEGMLKFLSFADFSHSISLLHPNWPENIFGKTYFLQPEFLVLPILAFASLFFISKERDKKVKLYILYFSFLGLLGAFLAKGVNDPFGETYSWFFNNLPGFVMFRDPTKWYLMVAISYAVLIPYTLEKVNRLISEKVKHFRIKQQIPLIISGLFVIFWLFTIREAVLGQLGGIFKPHPIPVEYNKLEKYLINDQVFSRTFWIPSVQRFGYSSNLHPAISSFDVLKVSSISGVINWMTKNSSTVQLARWGVRYVIVPNDSLGELFMTDRIYDNQKYLETVRELSSISWLKEIAGFGKIRIFEIPKTYDHFWLDSSDNMAKVSDIKNINPTKYIVNINKISNSTKLIFSESFNVHWNAMIGKKIIKSKPTFDNLNSFDVPVNYEGQIAIEYKPQKLVNLGVKISLLMLMVLLSLLSYLRYVDSRSEK